MTTQNVARRSVAEDLSAIIDSPEVVRLIADLEATRWTGRPGYPIRSMVGMALAKSLYAIPTWTRTVALVREHAALAAVIAPNGETPSVYACYRFTAKLRRISPRSSWRQPRFPYTSPRAGSATISPSGVTRLRSGGTPLTLSADSPIAPPRGPMTLRRWPSARSSSRSASTPSSRCG